ncbi:MAG: hypothetical protein ACTSUO_08805 [Candidatus Thorarchaeota archaeon]
MSESDEKFQKAIIELNKGNDKKAFGLLKDVYEDRREEYQLKAEDNSTSIMMLLDALNLLHSLVWLRVAEAGKEKKMDAGTWGKALGTVEAARLAIGPLVLGIAQIAKEENITRVETKARGLLAATDDLGEIAKKAFAAQKKVRR